jgi:uncharacterized protein
MPPIPMSSPEEVDRLDALCQRLAGFKDNVSLEWVDGFMTALVAGPRAVAPSEWLPAMFDDAFDRAFADPEDVQQAMQALLGRWNVLARQLDGEALWDAPDDLRLSPLMVEVDDAYRSAMRESGMTADDVAAHPGTGGLWAMGFLDAVDAFADDWAGPADDEEFSEVLQMGLRCVEALLLSDAELPAYLADAYEGKALSRDELIDEACFAAQDLRLLWIEHAPRPETRRVGPQPGRNDPCPCGSGKKFKKCHGA